MNRREFLKGLGAVAIGLLLPKSRHKDEVPRLESKPEHNNKVWMGNAWDIAERDYVYIDLEPVKWPTWDKTGRVWVDWANSSDWTVMARGIIVDVDWKKYDQIFYKTCGPIQWEVISQHCNGCLPDCEDVA